MNPAQSFAFENALHTMDLFYRETLPALACYAEVIFEKPADGSVYIDTLFLALLNMYAEVINEADRQGFLSDEDAATIRGHVQALRGAFE